MKCRLCRAEADTLLQIHHYSRRGIMICGQCWDKVQANQHKPYSKVMERLAIAEAGYRVNRQLRR